MYSQLQAHIPSPPQYCSIEEWVRAKSFSPVCKSTWKFTEFFLNFQHKTIKQHLINTTFAHKSNIQSNDQWGLCCNYRQCKTNLEFLHLYSSQRKCKGSSKSTLTQTSKCLNLPQPVTIKTDAYVPLLFCLKNLHYNDSDKGNFT